MLLSSTIDLYKPILNTLCLSSFISFDLKVVILIQGNESYPSEKRPLSNHLAAIEVPAALHEEMDLFSAG